MSYIYHHNKTATMYHPDLREEIKFLKARLLYKTKKLDEARAANLGPEKLSELNDLIKELEEKLHLCQTEVDAQAESDNENGTASQ
jgi:DNA repair exonuclease SbcCD ATPase subunit